MAIVISGTMANPDCTSTARLINSRKLYHPWTLPILMLTVKDRPVDQLRGFAHGADAYITKPFNSQELFQTVALLTGETAAMSGSEGPA